MSVNVPHNYGDCKHGLMMNYCSHRFPTSTSLDPSCFAGGSLRFNISQLITQYFNLGGGNKERGN